MTGDGSTFYGYQGMYANVPVYVYDSQYSYVDFPSEFTPTPQPDSNFKDDYSYDYEKLSSPARDIESIRAQIKALGPGSISALGDMWYNAANLLSQVAWTTRGQAEALHNGNGTFAGWSSPAADEFLRWGPGATLFSLQQWQDAANNNAIGLHQLALHVNNAQTRIDSAWWSYVAEANADYKKLLDGYEGPMPGDLTPEQLKQVADMSPLWRQIYEHQNAIWRKWSHAAQKIAYDLSQQFYQVMENNLIAGRGTKFEGPSNAVVDMPGVKLAGGPGGPGKPPGVAAPSAPPPVTQPPAVAPPANPQLVAKPTGPGAPTVPGTPVVSLPATPVVPNLQPIMMSPSVAKMLGMSPFGLKALLAGPATGGLKATLPTGLTGNGFAKGGLGQLGGDGVLRAGAPGTGGLSSSGLPPSAPPSLKRGTLGRPGGSGGQGQSAPPSSSRRRDGNGEPARPGTWSPLDEHFGQPGATPPGASPPVLSRPRRTSNSTPPPPARTGPGVPLRPDASSPVLRATPPQQQRQEQAPTGPAVPAQVSEWAPPPTATRPVLGAPTHQPQGPANADGVALRRRPTAPAGDHGAPGTSADELGARRMHADTAQGVEHEGRVVGDEAFTVDTPGGSVLAAGGEEPTYRAEPKPTLGAG